MKKLWQYRTVRYTLYASVFFAILLAAIPFVMESALERWLRDNGADSVLIDDIDFNPFTGFASVEGVDVKYGGRTVIADADIDASIAWLPLLRREAEVRRATFRNVALEVEQQADGRWRIGSVVVGGPEPDKEKQERPWWLRLRHLVIENSDVRFKAPEIDVELDVELATLERFFSGPTEEVATLALRGSLNEAPVTLETSLDQLAPNLKLHGKLDLSGLKLDDFAGLLKAQLKGFAGSASASGEFHATRQAAGVLSAGYTGTISLAQSAIANSDLVFGDQRTEWDGRIEFLLGEQSNYDLRLEGDIGGNGVDLALPAAKVDLVQGHIDGKVGLVLSGGPEQVTAVKLEYAGKAETDRILSPGSEYTFSGRDIGLDGSVNYESESPESGYRLQLTGDLKGSALDVKLPAMGLVLSQGILAGKTDLVLENSTAQETAIKLDYKGKLLSGKTRLENETYAVDGDAIGLDGSVHYANEGDETGYQLKLEGDLRGEALDLALPDSGVDLKQGSLSGKAGLTVAGKTGQAPSVDLEYAGKLLLEKSALQDDTYDFAGEHIDWDGTVRYAGSSNEAADKVKLDGKLKGKFLRLALPAQQLWISQDSVALRTKSAFTFRGKGFAFSGGASVQAASTVVKSGAEGRTLVTLERVAIGGMEARQAEHIKVEKASTGAVQIHVPPEGNLQATLDGIEMWGITVEDLADLKADAMTAQNLRATNTEQKVLAAIQSFTAKGIATEGADRVTINGLGASGTRLLPGTDKESERAVAELGKADVSGVRWSGGQGIEIDTIDLKDLVASIRRDAEGKLELKKFLPPDAESGDPGKSKKVSADAADAASSAGVRLGKLSVSGKSVLHFRDASTIPPFKTEIKITRLQVEGGAKHADGTVELLLDGKIDRHGSLAVKARIQPDMPHSAFSFDARLKNLNLVPFSSYSVSTLGYSLHSGQFNLDSSTKIENGEIDSKNNLLLRKLTVQKADEKVAENLQGEVSMPLDKALSMLYDKQHNIELDVPITGKLEDIHFGKGAIIGKVLHKAVVKGVESYALLALGPYGVVALLGKEAIEHMGKISLPPVEFAPGQAVVSERQHEYMEKLAQVLHDKPRIDAELCGFVTHQDELTRTANPILDVTTATRETKTPDGDEIPVASAEKKTLQLGTRRAEAVKEFLITRHEVDEGRLTLCAPEYDKESDAKPRVEILF